MKPACVIPFMGTDPIRVRNLQAVQKHYNRHFEVFMGTGTTIGGARNDGAFKAIKRGFKSLFFVDADIIVPIENVLKAVKIAEVTGSVVYPYGNMIRTNETERRSFVERGSLPLRSDGFPEGGALVLSHQGFINICGYPEINYGEDNIMHNVARCVLGPITRIWEPAFHLWHPSTPDAVDMDAVQVVRRTEDAIGNPDTMKRIILKAGYHDVSRFTAAGYCAS